MPEPSGEPRITSKKSILKAYRLLRSLQPAKAGEPAKKVLKPRRRKSDGKAQRVLKTLVPNYPPNIKRFPWHDIFMMQEIRSAMGKQDWIALQRLFPHCGTDALAFQPMRFTYAFLLSLCSHISNENHFKSFLETCISHDVVESGVLERLMTLQRTYHRQTKPAERD
ncbi:uncharacterized protein LOC107041328 [Diachasma alloeum]|uniref:uncharacterized protein LOC107041328 n=1 Tax=Diachasma alloeum TaxID=454923 RepID=UPI0007384E3D|nr:uncharacterized protein LOC107041328 [Diachasma alloeum]